MQANWCDRTAEIPLLSSETSNNFIDSTGNSRGFLFQGVTQGRHRGAHKDQAKPATAIELQTAREIAQELIECFAKLHV
jgi:hypothetical protein